MHSLVLGNGSYSIDKSSDSKCTGTYNGSDEDKLLSSANISITGAVSSSSLSEEFSWSFNSSLSESAGLPKGGFHTTTCKFGLFLFKNNT